MARVVLAPFIQSISGKVGNLEFRTLKSGKTIVHARSAETAAQRAHREPTASEQARWKRFGMVSSITAEIQRGYARIDEAAHDRQKIWLRVKYLYDKLSGSYEDEKELRRVILEKYDKSM